MPTQTFGAPARRTTPVPQANLRRQAILDECRRQAHVAQANRDIARMSRQSLHTGEIARMMRQAPGAR